MVDCNFENQGCAGGTAPTAIDFLIDEGVPSRECNSYKNGAKKCKFGCDNPKQEAYDKFYCKHGSLAINTEIQDIQHEIYQNGPVMVTLVIMEDLFNYKSGIYEYTTGKMISGHAIRAIGWGHDEEGHLYWVCQNQWTDNWGDKGIVNIKAGEIGIDSWALSCMPDINIE